MGDPAKEKRKGRDFYENTLGSPKYVVAPMVDQSELAWRELCRRHGAQLCYTPMFHSSLFAKDAKYRQDALQSCPSDRPLIVQFCGNDPKIILEAALLAQDHCDAVDINLGCPQAIARRGHYGSFLQDEWSLLEDIVSTLDKHLTVPVTCKIRIFEDRQRTVDYARMLVRAGAQMLTVHGRTREMKGPLTGIADWSYIRLVRESVDVPLLANGNIMSIEDVHKCIEETGADGVMTAEGNLYNPFIFDGTNAVSWEAALEYLDLADQYPCPSSYVRAHLFKIFHHLLVLPANFDVREKIAIARNNGEFRSAALEIRDRYLPYHEGQKEYPPEIVVEVGMEEEEELDCNLTIPPWICHSYVRAPPKEHIEKLARQEALAADPNTAKRQYFDDDGNAISRKRMKKLRRVNRRPIPKSEVRHERANHVCIKCTNPAGVKCGYKLCRPCCKDMCSADNLNCEGHKLLIKTNRERLAKLRTTTVA